VKGGEEEDLPGDGAASVGRPRTTGRRTRTDIRPEGRRQERRRARRAAWLGLPRD
jgi:hypothetical protein